MIGVPAVGEPAGPVTGLLMPVQDPVRVAVIGSGVALDSWPWPVRWIDTVEGANEDFFEEVEGDPRANFYSMAQRLVQALRAERQAAQDRLDMLDQILG